MKTRILTAKSIEIPNVTASNSIGWTRGLSESAVFENAKRFGRMFGQYADETIKAICEYLEEGNTSVECHEIKETGDDGPMGPTVWEFRVRRLRGRQPGNSYLSNLNTKLQDINFGFGL